MDGTFPMKNLGPEKLSTATVEKVGLNPPISAVVTPTENDGQASLSKKEAASDLKPSVTAKPYFLDEKPRSSQPSDESDVFRIQGEDSKKDHLVPNSNCSTKLATRENTSNSLFSRIHVVFPSVVTVCLKNIGNADKTQRAPMLVIPPSMLSDEGPIRLQSNLSTVKDGEIEDLFPQVARSLSTDGKLSLHSLLVTGMEVSAIHNFMNMNNQLREKKFAVVQPAVQTSFPPVPTPVPTPEVTPLDDEGSSEENWVTPPEEEGSDDNDIFELAAENLEDPAINLAPPVRTARRHRILLPTDLPAIIPSAPQFNQSDPAKFPLDVLALCGCVDKFVPKEQLKELQTVFNESVDMSNFPLIPLDAIAGCSLSFNVVDEKVAALVSKSLELANAAGVKPSLRLDNRIETAKTTTPPDENQHELQAANSLNSPKKNKKKKKKKVSDVAL